ICAIGFPRQVRTSAVKYKLVATSLILFAARNVSSWRWMEASTQCQLPILKRTKALEANGYRVLRYWNNDLLSNIDSVLADILTVITTTPTPNPSPQGGGEQAEPA